MIGMTGRWQSTAATTVTIAAAGTGRRNVLQGLNVISDAACTITIQSPAGTTLWQTQILAGGGGFSGSWSDNQGVFGAEGAALVIAVSAGNYTISASGIIVG